MLTFPFGFISMRMDIQIRCIIISTKGTDLDRAVKALRDKFRESQNRLYHIHKLCCIKQGKDETWDSFISRLRAEGEHCDVPASWLDTEILVAMIESGKSKRVRR